MIDKKGILDRTVDFLKQHIDNNQRVLIFGANGWLGKTATYLFHSLKIPMYLVGRVEKDFQLDQIDYRIKTFDLNGIKRFEPTIFIDAAFLTRNFVETFGLREYVAINEELNDKSNQICNLNSIETIIQFSSGASASVPDLSDYFIKTDPYSYFKKKLEIENPITFQKLNKKYSILRVWSVSGCHVKKRDGYLFSDLISQALKGGVTINSDHKVFRRYSLAEEVIAMGLLEAKVNNQIIDSGGELVEIDDILKVVTEVVSTPLTIYRPASFEKNSADRYYSDNISWHDFCNKHNYSAANLKEQVNLVYSYFT